MLRLALASGLLLALWLPAQAEMCTGCPIEFDPKKEGGEDWVKGALANVNSPHAIHLVKIVHATRQLVNGVIYRFKVQVVEDGTNNVKDCEVVFLSRVWVSKEPELLSEDCSPQKVTRQTRQLLGGLKDVDQSEMGTVQELANYAVTTLDDIDTDDNKQVVTEIIDAKKQLVNGIMYHLELKVKSTGCKEGHSTDSDCLDSVNGEAKLCKVQVHRSFADKSPMNAKVVKSECEPIPILGGIHPIDVNDDSLNDIIDKAVRHISDMTNSMYMSGLVQIIKASSQVVEGMKYYLTVEVGDTQCLKNHYKNGDICKVTNSPNSPRQSLCNVVVWEKPWENFMRVLSADCRSVTDKEVPVNIKKGRSMHMPGGPVGINTDDSYVQELSKFALSEMDKQTNSDYRLGIHNIIRATSQVVSGVKITLTMAVGETPCKKSDQANSNCKPSGPTKECTVVIWDRPWLHDRRVLKASCQNNLIQKMPIIELAGGISDVDVSSIQIKNLLPFTAQEMTNRINSAHTQAVVRVLKASTQIVAGTLTRMTVEISETDCLKSENRDPSNCKIQSNGESQICEVAILTAPWEKEPKKLTSLECHRKPREPVGF